MTPSPGEIWLVEIPFTDGSASKIRPVLILWLDSADVVVAAVTSASPRSPTDVILADWQPAGLRVASTVRLAHKASKD
jgi:mRNA interferase MazF